MLPPGPRAHARHAEPGQRSRQGPAPPRGRRPLPRAGLRDGRRAAPGRAVSRRNPSARRSITLKIDADIIDQLLRLDPTMRILGARSEIHGGQHTLVFAVDAPKAPPEALETEPAYIRDPGPDPIRLAHVDWLLRGG